MIVARPALTIDHELGELTSVIIGDAGLGDLAPVENFADRPRQQGVEGGRIDGVEEEAARAVREEHGAAR